VDGHGNLAFAWDHPKELGASGVGADLEFKGSWTQVDSINELVSKDTYTAEVTAGPFWQVGIGVVGDEEKPIGWSMSGAIGPSFPPVWATLEHQNTEIVAESDVQGLFYGGLNIISPDAAYYWDYFYDGKIDYGYNYDALYDPSRYEPSNYDYENESGY